MKAPTVHVNGTAKDDLLEALHDVSSTLNVAQSEFTKICPNGRDYYVQGPDAITAALAEYRDCLRRLEALKDEVDDLHRAIEEQGNRS